MHSRVLTCIFHGPTVFDQGDAGRIVQALTPDRLIVAGVMGRTAAAESGLAVTYADIPPSYLINQIEGDIILVNRGKTPASGRRFGEIVARRITGNRGLIHIECSDQSCRLWDGGDRRLARSVADRIGFTLIESASSPEEESDIRRIRGCLPGEPVFIEGIIIGHATADEVVIAAEEDRLVPIAGIDLKPHGVEKLMAIGCPPLNRAWCKSGHIRSTLPGNALRLAPRIGRVALIDHAAIGIYRIIAGDVCGIITVGDDTTAVCGHIGAVAGVPVFGITDGDGDGIVPEAYVPGSVIIHVISGTDDQLGLEIGSTLPEGRDICWDELIQSLLERFSARISVVRDLR